MVVTGAGAPVTIAAHGFGASIAETRPLLSGVAGSKVFYEARGHGANAAQATGYGELADDLRALAQEHGATQALGVSMGAHTLLRLLAQTPDRFTRVVLFLPASIDEPLPRRQVTSDEVAGLAGVPGAEAYLEARAAFMAASPGLLDLRQAIAADRPVAARSQLRAVTADVLVLAQEGDPVHPAQVARDLTEVLPRAELVVFDAPGVVFRDRLRLRRLISGHLGTAPNG